MKEALNNPNWDMGAKVTIDSASLVNKGLEVMEARWLFDVDVDRIQVVVQPQSIVHSAVQYVDGSVMAHLASPTCVCRFNTPFLSGSAAAFDQTAGFIRAG